MRPKDRGFFRVWDTEKKQFFEPVFEAHDNRLKDVLMTRGGRLVLYGMNGMTDESVFPDRYIVSECTGEVCDQDEMIYDQDLVEFVLDGEVTVDIVHWANSGWRVGGYEGSLADYQIRRIVGNAFEAPWPVSTI